MFVIEVNYLEQPYSFFFLSHFVYVLVANSQFFGAVRWFQAQVKFYGFLMARSCCFSFLLEDQTQTFFPGFLCNNPCVSIDGIVQ